MSQHDYNIANAPGATVRADINNALSAIASQNSGPTEPTFTIAYMIWVDTTTKTHKQRSSTDSAWIILHKIDSTITHKDDIGANIASAATVDLATATGKTITVTGSVAITSFGTVDAGFNFTLVFSSNPVITYNVTTLILPGGANITAAAGDVMQLVSLGGGNWRVTNYTRADGANVVNASETKKGAAELATQAEVNAGTDDTRIITPLKLKNNPNTGKVLQIVIDAPVTNTATSLIIPRDNTAPQITEGISIMNLTITPKSLNSIIIVEVSVFGGDTAKAWTIALFKDGAANALSSSSDFTAATGTGGTLSMGYFENSGSLTAKLFSVRMGTATGVVRFNQTHDSKTFGNISKSFLKITEVLL